MVRIWSSDGTRHVFGDRETYQIYEQPWGRDYSHYDWGIPPSPMFGPAQGQMPWDRARLAILFDRGDGANIPTAWNSDSRYIPGRVRRSAWQSIDATLDGKRLLRFDSELTHRTRAMAPNKQGKSWWQTGESWSFWVEPQTRHIVRREVTTHYEGFGRKVDVRHVSDGFRYNVAPPAGLFDAVPPTGSRYSFVPLPERQATDEEQAAIEAVVRCALDARIRGDYDAYLALWDFDCEFDPGKQKRRRRYEEQQADMIRGRGLRAISRARSRISGVFTRRSADDPFPPTEPNEFGVVVTADTNPAPGKYPTAFISLNEPAARCRRL